MSSTERDESQEEPVDSWLSTEHEVPPVVVEFGLDEDSQMAVFANSTLGRSRDEKWAVSIACYIDLDKGLDRHAVLAQVQAALQMAANASPILMFDARIGPSLEYEEVIAEEERAIQRGDWIDEEDDE